MLGILKRKINLIKLCAVFTTVCFVVSTIGANLYAIPMSENVNKKYEDVFNKASSISNEYGKITSSKDAKSDITVINIQDLHCHPQTQRNISKIIGQIADKYNLKKVYVEGGYGDIDVSWLNQIKDENIRRQVIEKLLEEGILTGSEYYKLTNKNDKVELKGIDEEKLHKENIKRLSWIIENQNKYKEIISKINQEINFLEQRFVNDRNKKFNKIVESYLSNKTDSKRFYRQLMKYVKDINDNPESYNNITAIRLEDYPNISKFMTLRKVSKDVNIKDLTQELQIVINELKNRLPYQVYTKFLKETENLSDSQKVLELVKLLSDKENINLEKYKSLNNFLKTNSLTKQLNPINLVLEERQLLVEIRKALSYNNEEYEITFISDFNKHFQDYLEYKLTDADWKYFEKYYSLFRRLYAKYANVDRIKEIEQDFAELNKYYNINDKRNNIFVEKLLDDEKIDLISKNKLRTEEEILKNSKEVIIAVTGGFHSSELEQLLASSNVNTIVITPKIYENIDQSTAKYIELIQNQSLLNSQALAYTLASCTTDINKQKLLLSIVKDILGDNTEILEKVLGKKVDLSILDGFDANIEQKKELRQILETSVKQVLNVILQKGMKDIIVPDIDEIMLWIAEQLVRNGIFFSDGMIFEIENSDLRGKDLQGIPAEIYSRMLPSLQKALFNVAIKDGQISEDGNKVYDDKVSQGLTEQKDGINYFSIFAPLRDRNKLFYVLAKIPHIWEELIFRALPLSLLLLPAISFLTVPVFAFFQIQFIRAHNISSWIEENNLNWKTIDVLLATLFYIFPNKEFKDKFIEYTKAPEIKVKTLERFLATFLLSVPYIYSLFFAQFVPVVTISIIVAMFTHKCFNSILKNKLNIFDDTTKQRISSVEDINIDFEQSISLNDEADRQKLLFILNKKKISKEDAIKILDYIIDEVEEYRFFVELLQQITNRFTENRELLVETFARKMKASNYDQISLMEEILETVPLKWEAIVPILLNKLDLTDRENISLIKTLMLKNKYNSNLTKMLIEKVDFDDKFQLDLLYNLQTINNDSLSELIEKIDIKNLSHLQLILKAISKADYSVSFGNVFSRILQELDLSNLEVLKMISNFLTGDTHSLTDDNINLILQKINLNNDRYIKLLTIISQKPNGNVNLIFDFLMNNNVDLNNRKYNEIFRIIIDKILLKYNSYGKAKQYFQSNIFRLPANTIQGKRAFSLLIDLLHSNLIAHQNKYLRIVNGYIILRVNENGSDHIFNYIDDLTQQLAVQKDLFNSELKLKFNELVKDIEFFRKMEVNTSRRIYTKRRKVVESITANVSLEEFCREKGFSLIEQTPNVYFDSNRYSFTNILSLFPKRALMLKPKKQNPTYFMTKSKIDSVRLNSAISTFNAYMKLLDENAYVLNKFAELDEFSFQFYDVVNHINLMIDYLEQINDKNVSEFRKALEKILEKIENQNTTISQQKELIEYSSDSNLFDNITTINTLVNRIHQYANFSFVTKIMRTVDDYEKAGYNTLVSKDANLISVYNLSSKEINPQIIKFLLELAENPDFSTDTKSPIFIKDNIFLWVAGLGAHSVRILIDFNEDSKSVLIDFQETAIDDGSTIRVNMLEDFLTNIGFNVKKTFRSFDDNTVVPVGIVATLDKDTGLTRDMDFNNLAKQAVILFNNAASLNNFVHTKFQIWHNINVAKQAIMDIYSTHFALSAIRNNFVRTVVNNRITLNKILRTLELPLIPIREKGFWTFLKIGFFRVGFIRTFGQNTIDKYINKPIEEAFATDYLKVNELGYLERNRDYNPILYITDKLNTIINDKPGNIHEIEMLDNGAILSQVPEQIFNLKTCAQIGGYILKTGYVKLINGTMEDGIKGEFLNVRMLIDKNGVIRYSESELVGLPENMKNKTGRIALNPYQLQQILLKEGYAVSEPEQLTDRELITYRTRLQENISNGQMPTAYGTLLSKPTETNCVVGAINREHFNTIFIDKYATPENVSIVAQHEISLFNAGAYTSHAGIVLREYHKTAMVVNNSQIAKQGMIIKFYQPKNNILETGKIRVQEIEEKEICLQDKDVVVVDLVNNRLVLFPYSVFKNTLLNLQKYINNQDEEKIKEFLRKYKNNKLMDKIIEYIYYQASDNEWLQKLLPNFVAHDESENISERVPRVINKIKLTIESYFQHNSLNGVYRFGEEESLDKTKVGTKSANQSKLYLSVEQLKRDTGIENVAVPNGIAFDYTILEKLLHELDKLYNKGYAKEYTDLYAKLTDIIQSNKDERTKKQEAQNILLQIINLINNIPDSIIRDYIGRNNLKIFKRSKVIVRSSGLNEDGDDFSAAGIAESIGDIDYGDIPMGVKKVLSSFFSPKAFDYMSKSGKLITPSILIEEWIEADKAGVMMSEDRDGHGLVQVINGRGEDIVSGKINPYSFVIDIDSGTKIDGSYTNEKTITKDTLEKLVKIMYWLEKVEGVPVDIEFLIKDDIIYIVQVRPITALDYDIEAYIDDLEYIAEYDEEPIDTEIESPEEYEEAEPVLTKKQQNNTGRKKRTHKKSKKTSNVSQKKSKDKGKEENKKTEKKQKAKNVQSTTYFINDDDIRQPYGLQEQDIKRNLKKLAQSKDSLDKTYELNLEEIKKVLLAFGLTRQQIEKINFDEGLPDYVVALLKSKNSQVLGTTIDPNKSLIENLKEHPILFSLVIQTFIRVYASDLKSNSTFGDLLNFIEMRYFEKLSEATSMDLRGFFGEYYTANTLIAGFIPDKRAGPIIIRPQLADSNNARGYDIYNPVNDNIIQVKIGGSGLVHKHFRTYWKLFLKVAGKGLLAIPVITTKNVKANSFPTDGRVQGLDITTETATKFAHDIVSALYGISYKKNIPAIRDIRLKDLIDSFKGFPNERSITVDTLVDILTKNQVKSKKKDKKYLKKQEDVTIEFIQGRVNVDSFANQDIVVTTDSQATHVICINDEKIFVNEQNKEEIREQDFPLYGIEKIEYDEDGYISVVVFKKGVSLSVLTIDGNPKEIGHNVEFSDQEIKSLNSDSKTEGYIDVYLDGDIDEICHLIKKAATENKLIIIHFFKDGFKTSDLTPSQLLDMYKKILKLISSRFKLSDIFPNSLDFSEYTDYGLDFFFEEVLKNALLRGNFGRIEDPIALNLHLDENANIQIFSVYNKAHAENEVLDEQREALARSAHLMLIGERKSTDIMTHNSVRKYSFNKKYSIGDNQFRKAEVLLREVIDMEMYDLEQEYKKRQRKRSNSNIILQTRTTIEKLYEKGLKKYRKQILKQPERIVEELSPDDLEEVEVLAQDYKYTISGILYGVFNVEFFSFFSKKFISNHADMSIFAKMAVRIIRILSISVGLSIAIISFSVLPICSFILNFFVSVFFGTSVMFISAAILHSSWNILAVAMEKYSLVLQQNIIGKLHDLFKSKKQSENSNIENYQRKQNTFSQEEIDLLNKDTETVGAVTIYLDSTDFAEQLEKAIRENKLIILYLSEKQKYTSGLTEEELFKIYNEIDLDIYNKCISLKNNAFFKSNIEDSNSIRRFGYAFYLNEIIKNAFVHGNKGMLEMPIALSIKMKDGEMDEIAVYNRNLDNEEFNYESREEIIKRSGLSGRHLGKKYMKSNPIRTYLEEPKFDDGHFYKVVSKFNRSVTKEEIKKFQKELLYSSIFSILPENIGLVNIMLQDNFNVFYIAFNIALMEFKASLKPTFIDNHQSYSGKKGGKIVRYLMNKYQITSEDGFFEKIIKTFILLVVNTESIVKHIIIDYKFIKSSGITEAINMFGDNTYMDEFGQIHVPPVLIVNDLQSIRKKYKLRSTGIHVNGRAIFQVESNGILIYGAQGMKKGEIERVLNESTEIKEKIENIIKAKGFDNVKIEIEGVMFEDSTDILRFDQGLTLINEQEIKDKNIEYVNKYVNSSIEIKRSIGVMYSQKALVNLESLEKELEEKTESLKKEDLENLEKLNKENLEKLTKVLKQGRGRKIISKKQYDKLIENGKLSTEEIFSLRENGIEIYIDNNKIDKNLKESGISGQIIRDEKTNFVFIYDYYSEEKIKVEEIGEENILDIESKLINSETPILIDIKLLVKKFREANILDAYTGLNTLIGNIKIKTGIGQLNKMDIVSLGYNLDYNKIPELSLPENKQLSDYVSEDEKEEIYKMLNKALLKIPENSEIGIIMKAITKKNNKEIEEAFIQILKERILAKTALRKYNKEYGLKDKKLEILLGKMLFKQVGNNNKSQIVTKYIDDDGYYVEVTDKTFMKKIMQETNIAMNGNEVAINTIIDIILVYGDSFRNRQLPRALDKNDARNYRAMLAAA